MMLSNGATLAEVAHQLGHAPGSPMTRYARFLESAQRGIADRTQRVMDERFGVRANLSQAQLKFWRKNWFSICLMVFH